jgi:outer membrane receptor protein involved in Fe transport
MEAGADLLRGPFRRLSVTGFLRRSKDLIDWARPSGSEDSVPWETRNVEEATFRGLEVDMELRGPFGTRISGGGTLLSLEAEEALGYNSKQALRPLREQATLGIARDFSGGLTASLKAQRGKREDEDPYYRVDFRTGLEVGVVTLYLDATNILDEEYPDITRALAPGRGLFLGMELGSR